MDWNTWSGGEDLGYLQDGIDHPPCAGEVLRCRELVAHHDAVEAGLESRLKSLRGVLDGNRLRRQQELRLRIDDAWRAGLSGFWKAAALLLTWPFSAVYGYWRTGSGDRDKD